MVATNPVWYSIPPWKPPSWCILLYCRNHPEVSLSLYFILNRTKNRSHRAIYFCRHEACWWRRREHNSVRRVGTFWKPYSCQVGSQQVSTDRCLRDPRQSMSRSHFSIPEHCFVAKQLKKTLFYRDTSKYGIFCRKLLKYALWAKKWLQVRWEPTPHFVPLWFKPIGWK